VQALPQFVPRSTQNPAGVFGRLLFRAIRNFATAFKSRDNEASKSRHGAKALLEKHRTDAPWQEPVVCSFACFCCCNGKCGLCVVAAVVRTAVGHVKDLVSCACAPCGALRLLLQYLGFLTIGSCEHLAICAVIKIIPAYPQCSNPSSLPKVRPYAANSWQTHFECRLGAGSDLRG
jgi:hypothetical protein